MRRVIVIYEPFAVVAVPFPFTDNHVTKKRPAVVISKSSHQKSSNHVTLLMVTSAKHSRWQSDHKIIDLAGAGLTAPSVIRQKIFTLDARLILKILGHLSKVDQEQVLKNLTHHLIF